MICARLFIVKNTPRTPSIEEAVSKKALLPSGSNALGDISTFLLNSGPSTLPPQDVTEIADPLRNAL